MVIPQTVSNAPYGQFRESAIYVPFWNAINSKKYNKQKEYAADEFWKIVPSLLTTDVRRRFPYK
jgi:hypothetical protein